ncbi:hypothetical protein C4K26_3995 [Pseudomonas chlororaphis]|nr:hypothetical protein C4K26_3995 [Pseudomonas chlororaphis]
MPKATFADSVEKVATSLLHEAVTPLPAPRIAMRPLQPP